MATDDDDPLEQYIKKYDVKVKDTKEMRRILYEHALDTIENRLVTQLDRISNEHLYEYASNLFLRNNTTPLTRAVQADTCVLEIRIFRADSLAPKDVAGTSDPYCILGLSDVDLFMNFRSNKKNLRHYNTSVKQQTLSPEWNERIEIPLTREQVENYYIHIQVWDYDDEESMAGAIQSLKDVKGIRGVGRFMKEVAQSVGKNDSADDFMGFIAVPLRNIKLEGMERWFGLRSTSALQHISGRIRVAMRVSCPHLLLAESHHPGKMNRVINGRRIKNGNLTNEEIYGGIVTLVVNGRHNIYKDLLQSDSDQESAVDGWDGKLQRVDECLLMEMETQRRISGYARAIVKWLTYCQEHIQLPDGIQMQRMTELLKALDAGNDAKDSAEKAFMPLLPIAGSEQKNFVFTFDKLPKSFDDFLRHCHRKIENHTEVYPVKQNDTIIRLGEILICLRSLRESKLYLTAKLVDTTMFGSGDIKEDIADSIKSGLDKLYDKLCDEYKIVTVGEVQRDSGTAISKAYNVLGMVKLVDAIHTALVQGRGYYHPVFKKVLKLDYMSVALETICKRLADDLMDILPKVNKEILLEPDPIEEGAENQSTAMFQLYLSLRDFAAYVGELFADTDDERLLHLAIHQHIGALKGYHEWFRPTILRWLQMSRGRAIKRLSAAVKLDKVERIDDIAKHSSSSVDAIGCLTSHVVTFWHQIKWPDIMDGFLIATRITEDLSNGVELYADLVHDKLKAVGFFDDEGQFDVTEELCLALNNLEKVKSFLKDVLHEMEIESFVLKLEQVEEAPSKDKSMACFQRLIENANDGMKKKIMEITSIVGSKMQPDILRYLREYVKEVLKSRNKKTDGKLFDGFEHNYDSRRGDWEKIGEESIRPLMHYLTTNVITLKEWLCDILWQVCLRCVRQEILIKQKNQIPHLFSLTKYILDEHLVNFFHAGGEGISLETMSAIEEYKVIHLELKMRSATTEDLIRLFFDQMYGRQESMADSPYGILNVFARYDKTSSSLQIDVISAENLIPKDMNGLSDPFVEISLMPKQMFPANSTKKTAEIKNTVDPIWTDESFTFEVPLDVAVQEGASMVFTVFDYDLIGRNDLEGECVLPLNILEGLNKESGKKSGSFRLTLSLPNGGSSAERRVESDAPSQSTISHPVNILDLLKQRTSFDKEASEFCRWRRKLTDAVKPDEIPVKLLTN